MTMKTQIQIWQFLDMHIGIYIYTVDTLGLLGIIFSSIYDKFQLELFNMVYSLAFAPYLARTFSKIGKITFLIEIFLISTLRFLKLLTTIWNMWNIHFGRAASKLQLQTTIYSLKAALSKFIFTYISNFHYYCFEVN